ncbi:hypothetical protein ACFW5D_37580, partial [Streptomyces sp. NPDC058770]|uniref:hypothetical protein n=1 Tax=Streptomyces sp. NPDC058770 TaxID=3346631 RepID=UPI0036BB0332
DDNTRPASVTTNGADTAHDLAISHGKHRCSTNWLARAVSCLPRTPLNRAVVVTSLPAYTNVAWMRSVRILRRSTVSASVMVRD